MKKFFKLSLVGVLSLSLMSCSMLKPVKPSDNKPSEETQDVTPQKLILDTPTGLRYKNGVLTWEEVKNADYYIVDIDKEQYKTSSPSFKPALNKMKTYTARIQAQTYSNDIEESSFSMPLEFMYQGESDYVNESEYASQINSLTYELTNDRVEYPQNKTINKKSTTIPENEYSNYDEINDALQMDGYDYEYQKVTATASYDDITSFGINEDIFYPGALVKIGNGLTSSNVISPLTLKRSPFPLWMNSYAATSSSFLVSNVSNPSPSTVYKSINDIVNNNLGEDTLMPYQLSSKITNVSSEFDLSVALNCDINSIPFQFKSQFDFSANSQKSYAVLMIKQVYYTIYTDPLSNPADFFNENVTLKDIQNKLRPNEIPAYISGVQYGRIIMMTIESDKQNQDIAGSIDASGSFTPIKAGVAGDYIEKLSQEFTRCNYFVYGGSTRSNQSIFETTKVDDVLQSLTKDCSAKDMVGKPITYLVRYLDGELAKISSANEYVTSTRTPKSFDSISAYSFNGSRESSNSAEINFFQNNESVLTIEARNDYGQHYIDNTKNNFEIKCYDSYGNLLSPTDISARIINRKKGPSGDIGLYDIGITIKNRGLAYALIEISCGNVSYKFDLNINNVNSDGSASTSLNNAVDILKNNSSIKHLLINATSADLEDIKNKTLEIPRNIEFISIKGLASDSVFEKFKIVVSQRTTDLTIALDNFKYRAPNGEIAFESKSSSSNITFDVTGSCKIYGGNGFNGTDGYENKDHFISATEKNDYNGGNATNGTNGNKAVNANKLTVQGNGVLSFIGGNGGNGGNGGTGATRWVDDANGDIITHLTVEKSKWDKWNRVGKSYNGGNGGNGGNGSIAATYSSIKINGNARLELSSGNGGNGGNSGKGGSSVDYLNKVLYDHLWPIPNETHSTMLYIEAGNSGKAGMYGTTTTQATSNITGNYINRTGSNGKNGEVLKPRTTVATVESTKTLTKFTLDKITINPNATKSIR